ncbi:hypothetical protein R69927_02824 [Paraburkholderia domus]|uniref:Uncharacterized protein n=1 Tax=Paraburkholderia domus TaxID=2793075 RepID=A0A9N8MXT4_9BURK|nr:hypothetical protein R75483_01578 [Paraburkholderia domus]CAE6808580.1 hypothetical protein R69749_02959 [Paraburkholderia domus]CAE6864405.1 hypothetical protein R69927_02824 [Paraburkholderia domus]CAE6913585.1 hypothetical protein R75471_03741 [Paraburkholderia domus]CAE6921187.1 hypothetical protein R70211_04500 [Paraburkholderia domus]
MNRAKRRDACGPARMPGALRCTTGTMMTNSLRFDGLSKRHRRNDVKKPRARRGFLMSTVRRNDAGAGGSVEMRLRGFRVLRHFGVDDFAKRVRVERDAAVIAIFRLEAARVAAHVCHTGFLEQRDDFFEWVV